MASQPLRRETCSLLRWKAMFIEFQGEAQAPPSDDQIFWCGLTLHCLGPDGKVAEPKGCTLDRPCYEREE